MVPAGVSGKSGGCCLVEHHRTSVFTGFIINQFEAIQSLMSLVQAETRLAHAMLAVKMKGLEDK